MWPCARANARCSTRESTPMGEIMDKLEHVKPPNRAKLEHPFRVIKRQVGFVKVCYRGLMKNSAQLHGLFALSNLWMARHRLLQSTQGGDKCACCASGAQGCTPKILLARCGGRARGFLCSDWAEHWPG